MNIQEERRKTLEAIGFHKGNKHPNQVALDILEERLDVISVLEGTQNHEASFRWLLELVSEDGSEQLIVLAATSRKKAIVEAKSHLTEKIDRARLYHAELVKQFYPEEFKVLQTV